MVSKILLVAFCILVLITTPTLAADDLAGRLEQLEQRVYVLEQSIGQSPATVPTTQPDFTGTGSTNTLPFVVTSTPIVVKWKTTSARQALFAVEAFALSDNTSTAPKYAGGCGGAVSAPTSSGQSALYIPVGNYYFHIDTASWISWEVSIE